MEEEALLQRPEYLVQAAELLCECGQRQLRGRGPLPPPLLGGARCQPDRRRPKADSPAARCCGCSFRMEEVVGVPESAAVHTLLRYLDGRLKAPPPPSPPPARPPLYWRCAVGGFVPRRSRSFPTLP